MRVLVIVTENTSKALKDELLAWAQKTTSRKSATFEVIVADEGSNPSKLAEGTYKAYSTSDVANVIKTSEAIADWGRDWRLYSTTPTLLFVFEKQREDVPRRLKNSTRRRSGTGGSQLNQLRNDLSSPREV